MNTNKTLYAILAFAPLVMLIPMFFLMFSMFVDIFDNPYRYQNGRMPDSFATMMLFSVVVGIVGVIGIIMYIVHLTKNPHIPENSRLMWTLILVFAGTIGMIIYYLTWIRKEDELNAKHSRESSPWK